MKVFVSWSGELSKQISHTLKSWLPRLIQSVEVFYSPEDIEKGDNWDTKITQELSTCNYGIICLTSENTRAPWINFEAGAIAKALDARVSTILIDINPSDIKGPLSRYQATRLDKDDFLQLVNSINKALENPLDEKDITPLLDAVWPIMIKEFDEAKSNTQKISSESVKKDNNSPIEEILQLLRKQNSILSNPEMILPPEYFEYITKRSLPGQRNDATIPMFFKHIERLINIIEKGMLTDIDKIYECHFEELFYIMETLILSAYSTRSADRHLRHLKELSYHLEYALRTVHRDLESSTKVSPLT